LPTHKDSCGKPAQTKVGIEEFTPHIGGCNEKEFPEGANTKLPRGIICPWRPYLISPSGEKAKWGNYYS